MLWMCCGLCSLKNRKTKIVEGKFSEQVENWKLMLIADLYNEHSLSSWLCTDPAETFLHFALGCIHLMLWCIACLNWKNRKWFFSNLKHDCILQDGSVLSSLGELLSLVKSQQQDISELRQQLNMYQADQQQKMSAVVHEVQRIDERVSTRLGNTLAEFSKEECIQLSNYIHVQYSTNTTYPTHACCNASITKLTLLTILVSLTPE